MPTILRSDLTISSTYKLTDNVQLAPGFKITVLPGATLDLGGFSLVNFGTLSLEGSASAFAVMQNGTYGNDSAPSALTSSYGQLKNMAVTSFSSYGSISMVNSLVQNTTMETVDSNDFSNSIFISSPLYLGTNPVTIDKVTFFDSPVDLDSWIGLPANNAKITDSNFVGAGTLISLTSVFSLPFSVSISGSYLRIPAGSNFEAMVYDATDDLNVSVDFLASDFLTRPVTNSPNGFTVGTYTLSTSALLTGVVGNNTPVTSTATHTLSVVVERGVLGADAVLLKGLSEQMTLTDGLVTGHTVTYGTTTFDYAQIDALIMTVTRDGIFTDEFRQEITDAAPSAAALTYNDAVALVGSASIDSVVLRVAGADGQFVA